MNWSRIKQTTRRQFGFGLLEALVALVLISGIGFALLAWVQQNIDLLGRLRDHYREQEVRRMVLDWSTTVNFMENPTGEQKLGNVLISWKAEQQGDITNQSGYPMGIGLFDLALYQVEVKAFRQGVQQAWFSEQLSRLGYRKMRSRRSFLNE